MFFKGTSPAGCLSPSVVLKAPASQLLPRDFFPESRGDFSNFSLLSGAEAKPFQPHFLSHDLYWLPAMPKGINFHVYFLELCQTLAIESRDSTFICVSLAFHQTWSLLTRMNSWRLLFHSHWPADWLLSLLVPQLLNCLLSFLHLLNTRSC